MVRVALCFAGAWRDWPASWSRIQRHIVEPLGDVDVFGVSDSSRAGRHGRADPEWTVARMRETIGPRFRAGEHLSAAHMANVSGHTWAEISHTQAVLARSPTVFSYLYKIWCCGQLIHRAGIKYDAVIRMRPDLWPTQSFRMARIASGGIELQVGGRCVRFGEREVVIHAYTNFCGNDWMAIGSLAAMTVTMDLLRFFTPQSQFLSPDPTFDALFSKGIELAHNWLWWRTGTAVLRRPLFIELSRRRCTKSGCLRMPAWQALPRLRPPTNASSCAVLPEMPKPSVGAAQPGKAGLINDCGATTPGVVGDLEWFTGATAASPPSTAALPERSIRLGASTRAPKAIEPARVLRTAMAPSWVRPVCKSVPDLAVHNPLPPCRKVTSDEASYQPNAHRPIVVRGYGSPLVHMAQPQHHTHAQ